MSKKRKKSTSDSNTRKISKDSIVYRWVFNNLAFLVLLMFAISAALIYNIQNYYYITTTQYLQAKLTTITNVLNKYSTDTTKNFPTEVRSMVESFSDKDKMELMAISSKGQVVLTSSGFSPDSSFEMADYRDAMENKDFGIWWGRTDSDEKIMAVSYPVLVNNSDYSAMRVVVSMSEIDDTILTITFIIIICCLIILLPIIISGFYFVGSIIKPVQKINDASQKFARGDFSQRIKNDTHDEIGQLCASINHMADELSSADAMKNEFISSVSHELRTPLTAIKGWAETLVSGSDPETLNKGMNIIISETERLSQMVEELLDFSRMQSGKLTLQLDTIDIIAELEYAILTFYETAKSNNITLVSDLPEMLPFITGDKNRLHQVFINIIENAIKYSSGPDHESIIRINAAKKDNTHIIITIEDNGCGISAADLPKVKTKFYKANHTKRGSGIGLALVDEIVSLHKGELIIDSIEGEGTTVTIILPTKEGHS